MLAIAECDLSRKHDLSTSEWAQEEFGDALLGDRRRLHRLIAMASRVAERPGGKITEVFTDGAEREAAFRFVENADIPAAEIIAAAHRATARRCQGEPYVCVPVDQTDLRITDRLHEKGLGPIGDSKSKSALGLQVIDAIAMTLDGQPLGMCAQVVWPRREATKRALSQDRRRAVEDKETMNWLVAMQQVRTAFDSVGAKTKPWFQIDRGGDAWPVMVDAKVAKSSWLTVRAEYNRRLEGEPGEPQEYVWSRVEKEEPLGSYDLEVPGRGSRAARRATLQLHACRVSVDVRMFPRKQHVNVDMWAVRVKEIDPPKDGGEGIEWKLLTTFPVEDRLQDAITVVLAYATRWRIEELHKVWKSGACNVEDSQLEARDHIERWAAITVSAAARLLRLTHLSRRQPELPATVELSRTEIDAVILVAKPRGVRRGSTPTIATAVQWIAQLGGYTGKSSGGPPGVIVIARGLERIRSVVQVLHDHKM